ncbi:MAG: hypothetical protein LC746_13835 [Acidobacteria bacterium]|nr:hypothetical protein [Acidobacteriota bacterium]
MFTPTTGRFTRTKTGTLAVALAAALLCVAQGGEARAKSKKDKTPPRGVPVLWRDPGAVSARDTFTGPASGVTRASLRRVTVIKTEEGGYSPKFRVRDAAGRTWVAKVGKEAQSETAAVRLLWAVGYATEINYLLPCAHLRGAAKLPKDTERCEGDGFTNVRFEARPAGVKRAGEWKWDKNPFTGTREFQGLKTLMVLINNWDVKDSNNVLLQTRRGGRSELDYVISDLGATFGKTGGLPVFWRITRSRNDPEGFSHDRFVEGVRDDGRVNFEFQGKKSGMFDDVRVEDARWIGSLLAQLSDLQLYNVFRAANYTPEERHVLVSAVRGRINQLVNLPRARSAGR